MSCKTFHRWRLSPPTPTHTSTQPSILGLNKSHVQHRTLFYCTKTAQVSILLLAKIECCHNKSHSRQSCMSPASILSSLNFVYTDRPTTRSMPKASLTIRLAESRDASTLPGVGHQIRLQPYNLSIVGPFCSFLGLGTCNLSNCFWQVLLFTSYSRSMPNANLFFREWCSGVGDELKLESRRPNIIESFSCLAPSLKKLLKAQTWRSLCAAPNSVPLSFWAR